jgi:hypothetical protein
MKRTTAANQTTGRRYSREQHSIQKEFCDAYQLEPEQVGFNGDSLDPIFDFDALSVLSARLCDLPHVAVDFGDIQHAIGLATSTGYAQLTNGNTRKIFGTAQVGEVMHDGKPIADIHQAVKVSRARAMRTIHRMVGFDALRAHREFKRTGRVVPMQPRSAEDQRTAELAEIHIMAKALSLIVGSNRKPYENFLTTFFGKTSAAELSDQQRAEWLAVLRAWRRAQAITISGGGNTSAA